ncbi:MAG: hypothetical protein LEGION0398_MBIBDBAK_01302 [Legionellaceae bacterium]
MPIISIYFGITAVIPLSLLAGNTAQFVLKKMVTPITLEEKVVFEKRHTFKRNSLQALIWLIAILSSIPFLYLTHTYLFPFLHWWVIPFNIAAVLAPIFVNSWALKTAIDNLLYVIYQSKKNIFKNPLKSYEILYLYLYKRLKLIYYIISRLRSHEINKILHKIINPHQEKNIDTLFKLGTLRNKRFKSIIPRTQIIFSYTGAIIGAVSEYQYFGTGYDAALWLHTSKNIAIIIGLSSLICNSTLMGYTGKIVFEEIYAWLDRQRYKLQKVGDIELESSDQPHFTPKTILEYLFFYIKKITTDISGIIILIIAISAATPNVYLTILQQKTTTWYNYLWLVVAFLGPFCTNFFSISRAIHKSTSRQKIQNIVGQLIIDLPHFKLKHLFSLKNVANKTDT